MSEIQKINKCALIHYCIETKKCKWGHPSKKDFQCLFYEQKIVNYKEKKMGKLEKKIHRLKVQKENRTDSLRKRITKLTRKIDKISDDYNKKIDKLTEVH